MHTPTFLQKASFGWLSWRNLLPLLTLFVGLSTTISSKAQTAAQTSITSSTVIVSRNGGANETFNANPSTPTPFDGANLGSYDINSGKLILKGGTVTTHETGTSRINSATLVYTVYDPDFNNQLANGTILLTQSGAVSNGDRTFTAAGATINLASLVANNGAASGYNVVIYYTSTFKVNGTGLPRPGAIDDNSGIGGYAATFDVTGTLDVPPTITSSTVLISRNGAVNETFNANPNTPNPFDGVSLGSFDINAAQLLLNGGTVTTQETGTTTVTGAQLNYTLYDPSFTTVSSGSITLNASGSVSGGSRTFATANANINLVNLVPASATGYTIAVSFRADYLNNGVPPPRALVDTNSGLNYSATFNVTGTRIKPTTLSPNAVFIAPNAGVNVTYNINPSTPRPFIGADLSSPDNGGTAYDVTTGQLLINGGSVTTTEDGPNVVTSVVLYYRTRSSSAASAYQAITLTQTASSNGTRTFSLTTAQLNIIASSPVITSGTYNLDVYFQANITNSSTNAIIPSITSPADPNSPYSATFTVTGTAPAQTIWVGGKNDNWFDAVNWSNGVPTRYTDVLIRDLGAGNKVPYPNIYSGVQVKDATGVLLFDNTTSGPAETRNLIMGGTSQASRSITRLQIGRLRVFGDFNNSYDSFIQSENTTIELAGGNQNITGGSFVRVEISGGGTKFDAGIMNVSEAIVFIDGLLTTDIKQPLISVVVLSDRAAANDNNGAQLVNETDHNYLRGFVRTTRQSVLTGETRTYGGMGMTLTFKGDVTNNSPGDVTVTRNTVESYNPLQSAYSIRRIFGVRPTNRALNSGGLNATMIFGYQNIDTRVLAAGAAIGTDMIPEQNLSLFVSANGGNTFSQLGKEALDTTNNTLTKSDVTSFATFTLGDFEHPLPVVLTAFNATRNGLNTQVTWATASEKNSAGFEVQVSTDGSYFRKLGFVNSQNGNSTSSQSYSYLDTEANKSGIRYYRLRQVDTDGTEDFSPVRAIDFSNTAGSLATALSAYPNPYGTSDAVKLSVQTTSAGTAHLRVSDLMGRTVANQTFTTLNGVTEVAIDQAASLNVGSYMAQVTLPSGEVKTVRIQKR